ncbi:hypothetical protein [Rhodococcus rhodnii]|uniref:TetR family transcriptional regulator n=1 Tax=Rhodococcus rhodnii LMG 5362 TaxID=1273125 RepID=R7WLF2_9NOCA|nr:hypothetical protein [Rhodococcus rhodnii]EOM76137.1 hypothetical protein Rrhod_2503 [Rhodococcus rhodnii LMG 5362]
MYNWELQNAIVAFVDMLRPSFPQQAELYQDGLHSFATFASDMLTMMGYSPR